MPATSPKLEELLEQHSLKLDAYGDNVPGDMFRIRYDTLNTDLNKFYLTSTIRAECEVYGMFNDLILLKALEQEG